MRLLQIHNMYRSDQPSGENLTVDLIGKQLKSYGHELTEYFPSSDALIGAEKYMHAAGPIGISPSVHALRAALRSMRPDVALIHNVYPMMGPAAIELLAKRRIPVVHVVHNYRHSCIAGTHRRSGQSCFACQGTARRASGIVHRCYRGSATQSFAMTAGEVLRGSSWHRVAAVIHLSQYMKDRIAQLSPIRCQRQVVVHNPIEGGGNGSVRDRKGLIYVGRLAEEKGVRLLLKAWTAAQEPGPLHVVGDGPLRAEVEAYATSSGALHFHGLVAPEAVAELRAKTAFACVPALWDEPFGRVAAEAHAAGQPVLATSSGALPEIVVPGTGQIVEPTVDAWRIAIERMASANLAQESANCVENWRARFAPDRAGRSYEAVLTEAAQRTPATG